MRKAKLPQIYKIVPLLFLGVFGIFSSIAVKKSLETRLRIQCLEFCDNWAHQSDQLIQKLSKFDAKSIQSALQSESIELDLISVRSVVLRIKPRYPAFKIAEKEHIYLTSQATLYLDKTEKLTGPVLSGVLRSDDFYNLGPDSSFELSGTSKQQIKSVVLFFEELRLYNLTPSRISLDPYIGYIVQINQREVIFGFDNFSIKIRKLVTFMNHNYAVFNSSEEIDLDFKRRVFVRTNSEAIYQ